MYIGPWLELKLSAILRRIKAETRSQNIARLLRDGTGSDTPTTQRSEETIPSLGSTMASSTKSNSRAFSSDSIRVCCCRLQLARRSAKPGFTTH